MALLVGALSARRLRSRHFLASCIENESLEDELACKLLKNHGCFIVLILHSVLIFIDLAILSSQMIPHIQQRGVDMVDMIHLQALDPLEDCHGEEI